MKRILFSLMAVVLCLGLMGGAFAYFSDVETSTGNTFTAGTIDLAVNDENPWGEELEWDFIDIKPCLDLDPVTIRYKNVGNNPGVLYTCIKYNESDKMWTAAREMDVNPNFEFRSGASPHHANMEMTADQFAALLYVEAVTYQYSDPSQTPPYEGDVHNDLPNWLAMDSNGDGRVSIYEMNQFGPIPYDPTGAPLPATASIEYIVTLHLGDSLDVDGPNDELDTSDDYWINTGVEDNQPQADGIELIVSGILVQVGAPAPTCP